MCPISGGYWSYASYAGVWALSWNNSRGSSYDSVGFRSDSASPRTACADGGAKGDVFLRTGQLGAKSARHPLTGRGCKAIDGLGVAF